MQLVDLSLLIVSSVLGLFLAVYVARRRRASGAQALSVMILGASIWSLGYAFEILTQSLQWKLFWEKFEFFGIVIIPVAWFTFVAHYLGQPAWMRRVLRYRAWLAIIPAITLMLVWTNEVHGLMWQVVQTEHLGPLVTLEFERGPWFWVFMIYSYTLLLAGSIQLGISLFGIARLQRWQVILALVAILLPWAGNILYISGLSPEYFMDWMAFIFLLSGLLFSISLFRFQLVNLMPIAHETVFAGLSDCVLVLDLSDSIVDMNPAAKNMADCPGEQALGKNITAALPEVAQHIVQAGYSKEYKAEISLGNLASPQFYDLHISLLADQYNNPLGRVVVLHEISEHKRDQAELVRARDQLEVVVNRRTEEVRMAISRLQDELLERTLAEKRFEDVVESAPDAMFVLDQEGRILLVNAMAERMFGIPRDELLGMTILENLMPEEHRNRQREYFQQALADPEVSRTSFGTDLYAQRRDGEVFPIEVELSRLDISSGYWMAINIHDISERSRVEAALRESEQTYRALFENSGDAIFISDMQGHIIHGNQKATQMLGFSEQELKSLTVYDISAPDERDDVIGKRQLLLTGETLAPYTRWYLKHNGETLPTENYTVLVNDAQGKPKFYQHVARDISERIKAEQAQRELLEEIKQSNEQMRSLALRLQEVQELERKEIAAELHDRVGANLTGINLDLKILQNQMGPNCAPETQKRLEESLRLVEETTHKIRDVMADLNPPVLDEYGLVAAIKWYGSEFSRQTGIVTRVKAEKVEKRLDPGVERILFRLVQESLNNISKHANASRVIIGVKENKDTTYLMVKDNGIGFDPLSNGRTEEPHWGLLSMQQRAASIGAEFSLDSAPGKGTRVLVKLRRSQNGN